MPSSGEYIAPEEYVARDEIFKVNHSPDFCSFWSLTVDQCIHSSCVLQTYYICQYA